MLVRRWTPPSQVPTSSLDIPPSVQHRQSKFHWGTVFLLLIGLTALTVSIVYGFKTATTYQDTYHQQQQDAKAKEHRVLFDEYIKDISEILLSNSANKSLAYIQTKTLIVLKRLNVEQKQDLLLFLYSQKLLQDESLNLQDADFNDLKLTCSNNFHRLHLIGVQMANTYFINCHFRYANFRQTNLYRAQFLDSTIENSSFRQTNLDQSQFLQTHIRHVDFSDASLIRSKFFKAISVQGNQFINADLYQANFTDNQFHGKYILIVPHDFTHARYPNGSFHIDESEKNLLINRNNENDCLNPNQTNWKTVDSRMNFTFEFDQNSSSNCALLISPQTTVYQTIRLNSYSLLINTNQTKLSFSALTNCDKSAVDIRMYNSMDILHQSEKYSNVPSFQHISIHVPIDTQRIEVHLGNHDNETCYFTSIALNI